MRVLLIFLVPLFYFTKADIEQIIDEKSDHNVNQQVDTSIVMERSVTTLTSSPNIESDIPANISSADVISQTMSETYSSSYKPTMTQCIDDRDCPLDRRCVGQLCINECDKGGICGVNAVCRTIHHIATCGCKSNTVPWDGDPWGGCYPIDSEDCTLNTDCPHDKACMKKKCISPCEWMQCGSNTECSVTDHMAICTCKPGYTGNPLHECIKVPGCISTECSTHNQCPSAKNCIMGKCGDPCELLCGSNTNCTVFDHVPVCACKDSYSGNPLIECKPQVCSGNWPPSPRGKKKYYVETTMKADWIAAYIQCLIKGYRLVAIENKQELEDVREEIRNTYKRQVQFWTSGSDKAYQGRWQWAVTGEVITYFDWLNNQNGNEHCLELIEKDLNIGYKYKDESCTTSSYFICEYYDSLYKF